MPVSNNFLQSDQYKMPFPLTDTPFSDIIPPIECQQLLAHLKKQKKKEKVMVEVSIEPLRLIQDQNSKEDGG